MAYTHNRQLMYVKQKGTATALARAMDEPTWGAVARSPLGLLHTRAATQGSPNDNVNNHPVIGDGWVVVHNGSVWNDDHLFTHFSKERPAAVDTAALNLLLGQGQTVEESLPHVCTLRGSASVAAAHVARPDELVLFRLNGPSVHLFWLPAWSMLVWSSDPDGGKAVDDIPDNGFAGLGQSYLLPDDTALYLTPAGLKRYALTPKPYGPQWRTYSGGGVGGGNRTGFFPVVQGGRKTSTPGVGATKKHVVPSGQNSLAILADNTGLLEEPLFSGSVQNYHYLNGYSQYIPREGAFVLPTGYGRWLLTRTPSGEIAREFKPHKRVRRRWEQEFSGPGDPIAYTVTLPASTEQQDDLSDLLRLGRVDLVFANSGNAQALLCPWCGTIRHPQSWESRLYTCEWCNVQSLPPREVAEAGGDKAIQAHDGGPLGP